MLGGGRARSDSIKLTGAGDWTGIVTQSPAKMSATKYAAVASLLPTLTPRREPTAMAPNAPVKVAAVPVSLPPVAGVAANLDAKFAAAAAATVPILSGIKRPRSESDTDSP